jgi:hypothetical protein
VTHARRLPNDVIFLFFALAVLFCSALPWSQKLTESVQVLAEQHPPGEFHNRIDTLAHQCRKAKAAQVSGRVSHGPSQPSHSWAASAVGSLGDSVCAGRTLFADSGETPSPN